MKAKFYVLLGAFTLMTQIVSAQLNFGIKGGANIVKVEGKAFKDEFQYGYHLGGFVEIGLTNRLSVQPEVLFNQYQTRTDSNFSSIYKNALDISNYRNVQLNYLSIPILLSYKIANTLSLQAGPQFGVLMSQDKGIIEEGKDAFKGNDFSFLGGAQLNLRKLRLTGRYVVGLYNINDLMNQEKWKNQGWQLSAGFIF